MTMKVGLKLVMLLLLGAAPLVRASADTNTFAVLECKGQTFTNARISSVTAAYAIVFFDGGGKKVPLSDLPPFLQERYGYDPAKAEQSIAAEKQKKEALAQAYAEQAALEASTQGDRQKVRVLKILGNYIGDTHCEIEASGSHEEVLMAGGDFSPIQEYYSKLETLESDAAAIQGTKSGQGSRRSRRAAAMAGVTPQNNAAYASLIAAQLKAMKTQGTNLTTIYASPTTRKYANLPIWTYLGKAAP